MRKYEFWLSAKNETYGSEADRTTIARAFATNTQEFAKALDVAMTSTHRNKKHFRLKVDVVVDDD